MTTEDAQAAEKVALTDAEGDAWDALGEDTDIVCCCDGCNFYSPSYDESRECSIQTHVKAIVAARVAEAVDRERAAWAAKVGLCSQCGDRMSVMVKIGTGDGWCTTCLDEAADDTEALDAAKAEVWDEAAEAISDWMWNNPSPAGIPQDPPRNPYEARP